MDKETFEKIYTQFIDGTVLANYFSMYSEYVRIYYEKSNFTFYYKEINTICVNRFYNSSTNEYNVTLEIVLYNESHYYMETTSNM